MFNKTLTYRLRRVMKTAGYIEESQEPDLDDDDEEDRQAKTCVVQATLVKAVFQRIAKLRMLQREREKDRME